MRAGKRLLRVDTMRGCAVLRCSAPSNQSCVTEIVCVGDLSFTSFLVSSRVRVMVPG